MASDERISIQFSLGDYTRPGAYKVAMSVPELVAQTNAFSTKNRPGCKPKLEKSKPKELSLDYNVKCDLKTSDPAGHEVRVRFDLSDVKKDSTANDLNVQVSCTCPAFLYWGGQWNTYQRDSLEGVPRPLLTAPTERLDLRGHFVLCKHCAAVFERILPSVQHNIVKVLRQRDVDERKPKLPPTKERLVRDQEDMKTRLDQRKKRVEQNKRIQQELLEGLRKREEDKTQDHIVKRDEPSTPEERERVPVIAPDDVPEPEPVVTQPIMPTPPEAPAPVASPPPPTAPTVVKREVDEPAVKQTRPPVPAKPQKMPEIKRPDREAMQRLMREEQRRQQQMLNRRIKNNPGPRR